MKFSTAFLVLLAMSALAGLLFMFTGCRKDFSYEQTPTDTANVAIPPADVTPGSCASCQDANLPDSSWRAMIDGVVYCGKAEKSIVSPEKQALLFSGRLYCSADSGFVATVYLDDDSLTSDKKDLGAKMACYYYDQVAPSYVYMSAASQPLRLIISNYEHQTGKASGTFSGMVMDRNGTARQLKEGRFRIRF